MSAWRFSAGFFLAVSLPVILQCGSKEKTAPKTGAATWAGQMQGLASEVRDLIPFVYSRKSFSDPVNAAKIQTSLKQFGERSHAVSPEMGKNYFGEDPIVAFSIENLRDDVQRASDAFALGQKEYARGVTKTVLNHCFRCHSMTSAGNSAPWNLGEINQLALQPMEKADLLIAARRYDEAVKHLESMITDASFVQQSPFEFENTLRKYLSLMIRVEKQPARPLRELDRVLETENVPYYVAEQARAWRQSLVEWSRQKRPVSDLLAEARRRVKRATELQQYAKDHAGDIEYLRATALLHDYLRTKPPTQSRADAYWLLGQSYETLDELGYWNLHEAYFESCIRTVPKTDLAKKCYGRLEASVYMGFSGSSGVHIPENERVRLKRLKELSRDGSKARQL